MRILLLEDDNIISEQIKTYFEINEHLIDIYSNGQDLLNNAPLDNYDIFLFDINTPKTNGIDTLKIIREKGITIPAIFLTALLDIEHVKSGYEVGGNDYIRKPFDLEEVTLRINQLINKNKKKYHTYK